MARTRNSAASAKARSARPVSARTAARRARKRIAEEQQPFGESRTQLPETIGQARVWERKNRRYLIAGLCEIDAAHIAWLHSEGFGKTKWTPCAACQPIVDRFPTPGPKGSKWRKLLVKIEYYDEEQLDAFLDVLFDGLD